MIEPATTISLRLYVAAGSPNSERAMINIEEICREHFPDRYELEIVNVFQEPLRALEDGIIVTPTLVKLAPLPVARVVGDLSERASTLLVIVREGP